MGFYLKHGKNLMSVMTATLGTMHSFLRKSKQESVIREQMGRGRAGGWGDMSFNKNSLKKRKNKQNQNQNIRVSY